jgi:acyl-CoA dehydrogenase
MWISNAAESDVIMVQALTDPEKRQRGGITMFLVDRRNPGVKIDEPGLGTWLGPRAAQYVVHFDNCRVDGDDVLGEVGKGFSLGQRWLTIHDRLQRGPYALGKMQRGLDMAIEWAKGRVTFGRPIAERQAIQWKLVDMHVDITALRAMTYQAAARADAGEDVRSEAALVKMCAGDWGARCLDHAIQVHGAMGESVELPLTLFYRLLRHAQIGGGTSEIQRVLIARKLLGKGS